MKISFQTARDQLAKVGIGLDVAEANEGKKRYLVTTPVGSESLLASRQVVELLRDLRQLAVPA